MSEDQNNAYYPKEGFVLTHFLTVADLSRSSEFYLRIFGGKSSPEWRTHNYPNCQQLDSIKPRRCLPNR